MNHNINFFVPSEFACRCCGKIRVAIALVFWLDVIRRAVGRPLRVNSGFRCPNNNMLVGGAAASRHLIGTAADIQCPADMRFDDFTVMCRAFAGDGWEVVTYPSNGYIHIATPRDTSSKLWNGESRLWLGV